MKRILFFSFLFFAVFAFAQPKAHDRGSKGSYKMQGFYRASASDPKEEDYELWYEGIKIVAGHCSSRTKNGPWRYTNLDGSVFFQGRFINGKKEGAWKYYKDQKISCLIYYKSDLPDSLWQSYYPDGTKKCVISYKNGKANGLFQHFYPNGKPAEECTYNADSIVGTYIVYLPDGTIHSEIEYRNNLPYNVIQLNDTLGKPVASGFFKNGNGLLKMQDQFGNKVSECNYENGKKNGKAVLFQNGKIAAEGEYRDDQETGTWVYYDENSMVKRTSDYGTVPNEANSNSIDPADNLTERQAAEFPGGSEGMQDYLNINFEYPAGAYQRRETGIVYTKFTIDRTGYIIEPSLGKGSPWKELNEKALDMIKSMPAWTPAFQNGLPVRMQYNLPISFTLKFGG